MANTEAIRLEIKSRVLGPSTRLHSNEELIILLLCEVVDELKRNAENRKKALENWKVER